MRIGCFARSKSAQAEEVIKNQKPVISSFSATDYWLLITDYFLLRSDPVEPLRIGVRIVDGGVGSIGNEV